MPRTTWYLSTHGYFCHELEHIMELELSKRNEMCKLDLIEHNYLLMLP